MAEDEEASAIESCYLTESHEISHEIKDNNMVICIEQEINIQNQSLAEDVLAAPANEIKDVLTTHANEEIVPLNLSNKSSVEDTSKAEDNENNDNLENNNKKQKSPTLHNKTQSPHVFKKSLTADELRSKKRISDSKTKEEERRAAVLQRKKKLEDEEKARKEAIYKRLSANTAPVDASAIRKKYSLSTSNLLQLRKNKQVEKDSDKKPAEKQKVMQRPQSSASTSNLLKSKDKIKTFDNKQSATVTGKDSVARSPTTRLNQRPSTALGISTYDKKTPQSTPLSEKKVKKDKDVERPSTAPKTLKSKSDSTSPPKKNDSVVRPKSDSCPPQHSSTPKKVTSPIFNTKSSVSNKSPPGVLLTEGESDTKKVVTKVTKSGIKSSESKASESKTKSKISDKSNKLVVETNKPNLEQSKTKPKTNVKNNGKIKKNDSEANSKAAKTEEEAKKALAEHRRKAKEEAEAKAKADKEKEEEERCRREEEERKLAQQLEQEEALQNALLEELRQEEEERRKKMIEEKEKRERDEKIRLEEEQRLRDEEIERKAKIELEKHLKDQELKEQELDAERIERKKRVEMIMARVSAKRLDQTNDLPTSVQNTVQTEENTYSLEINSGNEITNLKVEQSPHPDNLLENEIHSVSDPLNNTNKTLKNDTLNQVDFPVHLLLDNSDITSNDYNITNTSIVSVITDDEKVRPYHVEVSSNNNTVIQNGDAHEDITESWNKLEHHMKEMQMDTKTPSAEEKKLWKIVEGSVDISECY
ncbi:myb-like protein X isoform X2 [Hydra vulgaris]|uniref:Myb-like protein X isoform X2 n=1 Tax=Hydra vulgaris TaxID=6087 RepID=A0ABM4BHC0_HYDVU